MGYSFVPPHNPVNLRTNFSNRSRASAQKRKVSTKPSVIQKINRCGKIPKKSDHCGGATSLPVPAGVPVDSIWTYFRDHYVMEFLNPTR